MAWRDPVTGDELGLSDRLSWAAQGVIRRWTFVLCNIGFSLVWWTHPEWFGDTPDLPRWMALYSLLAVVIESVVGIGMFSQTRRDAVILRRMDDMLEEVRAIVQRVELDEERELQLLDQHITDHIDDATQE